MTLGLNGQYSIFSFLFLNELSFSVCMCFFFFFCCFFKFYLFSVLK